jgi:hypothetical protein
MMKQLRLIGLAVCGLVVCGLLTTLVPSAEPAPAKGRDALKKTFEAGNYKEAYEGYRALAIDPQDDPRKVGDDLQMGIQCLRQLNRVDEVDEFREQVIAAHEANWRLLQAAADSFFSTEHHGFLIAGKFHRGNHRGGGRLVNAQQRDRAWALQLMDKARGKLAEETDRNAVGQFYMALARHLMADRGHNDAWRLQTLTDLNQLPDYDEGWPQGGDRGAPVDADGTPVYYTVPKSWDEAKNDGQRWRWALVQAVEADAQLLNETRWQRAQFYQQQFGVQTLAQYGTYFLGGYQEDAGEEDKESGTYALHTLGEDETIARLATGVKRFKLPEEFNYIKLYRQIADEPATGRAADALDQLAQEFENRRQYDKAADIWRRAIKEYGKGNGDFRQLRLDQIIGNWGRFDGHMTQPAGKGATVEYRFRNGKQVKFEAREIRVAKLLDDIKAYLRSSPRELDWNKVNLHDIGSRLVQENQSQYVGNRVASWDLELEPREQHFDKRVTVTTPLQKSGAYLLTASMDGGNTSQIIVWLADTVIVKKPLNGKTFYFVADAVSGEPVAKANVEFFGYRTEQAPGGRFRIDTRNFAEFTDNQGVVMTPAPQPQESNYQWLIVARGERERFAFLGFTNVWRGQYYDHQYNETKVFTITDRPVYRPEQTVQFKFWVRHAKYDQADTSSFANKPFTVEIYNPRGEKIATQPHQADAYGGFEGEFELGSDAMLGQYQLLIPGQGGGHFRVEEYKKPEFEVTVDAPSEPVVLGEKIAATIRAKYYFGAPVTDAKVKYKVTRTTYNERWYPVAPWDWFYGPGYWWFSYDYLWYPGWQRWGCARPTPAWFGRSYQPPEVVADAEVDISPDGTVKVEIDTALAKQMHGDRDHQYQITAEVVDASRRTIVGSGNVMAAREPFKVFAWVDRGYYRTGETIHAHFSAHTLDRKPVKGEGKLDLLKITYDEKRQPVETSVQTWDLDTNAQGRATVQINAAAPGQYRLKYVVTDAAGHAIEGGYVFTVYGAGADAEDYRFNAIELVTDQREYQPGDKVKLAINSDRAGSTIALFLRPANGIYLPPRIIKLKAKSTIYEIDVAQKDMPNFFVEAMTISGGEVHTELKEIIVPPEKRVLDVEVVPSSETYKPGEKAKVQLKLTDFDGKPFVGTTVVAIYDKAVEYISGGSNVPEIKAFFWKWRRTHHPQTESTLQRFFHNLVPPKAVAMNDLGLFGGGVADELALSDRSQLSVYFNGPRSEMRKSGMSSRGMGLAGGFGGMAGGPMPAAAPMDAAAAPESAAAESLSGAAGAEAVQPTVRTNFADTALWAGDLTTDADGTAEVALDMPESLTTWKIKVWGLGHGTKVGEGEAEVITRKDLLVRLQAPRFFVQNDEVVLSANVHSYLKDAKQVQVVLELDGGTLEPMGESKCTIEVPAGGEQRVDWRVKVVDEGKAVIRMKALTDEESDAMEMSYPVYVHGMLKTESWSGALRPDQQQGKFTIDVPAERRVN